MTYNDLKHSSFTKSHLGACNMSFPRFSGMLSRLRLLELSLNLPNDLQMTSKWPKWPIMTWKHNSFTKSHLGACNMSFPRFSGLLSRLRLLELSLEPPNDLQLTSKWPQITHNNLKTNIFYQISLRLCNMSFHRWHKWPQNDLQMTSSDLLWPENIILLQNLP